MLEIKDIIEKLPRNPQDRNWTLRPLSAITRIVVHYDAVHVPAPAASSGSNRGYNPVARYIEQARYHMQKNWNEGDGPAVRGFGLMYHYRVSADGRVWRTQPEELVTWHAHVTNSCGLAICCDLGDGQPVPAAQLHGLAALLDLLCHHRPDIPAGRRDVWGHGELRAAGNHTTCPGSLLKCVQGYRNGQPIV